MNGTLLMIAMFCAIGVAQGVFIAFYLLSVGKAPKLSNQLLAGLLLAIALRVSKSIYYYLFDEAPRFFIGLGLAGLLAIGPFLWLYARSITEQYFKWQRGYFLHFIPAFVSVAIGVFLSNYYFSLAYRWGAFLVILYISAAWWSYYQNKALLDNNKMLQRWIIYVLIAVTVVWAGFIYQSVSDNMIDYAGGALLACFVFYGLFYEALRNPVIFSNKRLNGKQKSVGDKTADLLLQKLEKVFKEERIYQDPNLTLHRLSEKLKTPSYLISKVINTHYGMSFPEYVNDYRIQEVQEKLGRANGDFLKIEALAYEVGFNSASAFYIAFKKRTELTPQEYRNRIAKIN